MWKAISHTQAVPPGLNCSSQQPNQVKKVALLCSTSHPADKHRPSFPAGSNLAFQMSSLETRAKPARACCEHLQIQWDKDCQHLPGGVKWNSARPLQLHGELEWPRTAKKGKKTKVGEEAEIRTCPSALYCSVHAQGSTKQTRYPRQSYWPAHGWFRQLGAPDTLPALESPAGRGWGKEALPSAPLSALPTLLLLLSLNFALLVGRMKVKDAQHHQPSNQRLCCNLGYLVFSVTKVILFPQLSAIHISMKGHGHTSSLPTQSLGTLHFSQKIVIPFVKSDKGTLGKFSMAKILYFGLHSSNRTWHPWPGHAESVRLHRSSGKHKLLPHEGTRAHR